jgi:Carboxypeptidase regulatory-like domain/TonB-dependent Receptor Plug Domain
VSIVTKILCAFVPWWPTGLATLLLMLTLVGASAAQSTSASLNGTVVDATGALVPGVELGLVEKRTSQTRRTTSGREGAFNFSNLPPGHYELRAARAGFGTTEVHDIVLNVEDRLTVRVEMAVESRGEAITVVAEPALVNTSPSVGTVIDRQFVEHLPLNGRSFQSLLELTPGVVIVPAGGTSFSTGNGGQFSVNGQRANANTFTIDGLSAPVGMPSSVVAGAVPGQAGSGQHPGLSALGGTNTMVSVDALEEFKIQTSSFAPEFGRTPGGQVSLVTRSGTNSYRGSASYFGRNDALDATDWFINNRAQPKARMRQHNGGGVVGGPLLRNRLFFFASHESLRLEVPRAGVSNVPSLALRQTAMAEMRPYLNAFPVPNGSDLGNGAAEFSSSWSDPSESDATSVRVDSQLGRMSLFGRVSIAPSKRQIRSLSYTSNAYVKNKSWTLGTTWIPSARFVYDVRANYTTNHTPYVLVPDDFGGAAPVPANIFAPGRSPETAAFQLLFSSIQTSWGIGTDYRQRSFNSTASVSILTESHESKIGVDFRRIHPLLATQSDGGEVLQFTAASVAAGRAALYQISTRLPGRQAVAFDSVSLYAQDHWKISRRMTMTYGLRWEFVPPPHATEGDNAVTLENLKDPYGGRVGLAPRDTPLWDTHFDNLAPRVGASYIMSSRPELQLVIKGGVGKFYDLGFGHVANAYVAYPFSALKRESSPVFPISASLRIPPQLGVDPPGTLWVMDRELELPLTWQWNVSADQTLGHQIVTVRYVGAEGHKLLKLDRYRMRLLEWPSVVTDVNVNRNQGYSDYHALQVQLQRRLHRGVQSLVAYTLGRSRDTASSDISLPVPAERLPAELNYGYSDYDVRHAVSAAVTWDIPAVRNPWVIRSIARDWSIDMILRARSGSPVSVAVDVPFPPDTESVRPNVVPGQPFWIDDRTAPGGRRLNRAAFTIPEPETQGNLPRGVVRGFIARQVDVAARRSFSLHDSWRAQVGIEVFNVLNTPNFARPNGTLTNASFGVAPFMLNSGLGGLDSLYQLGGPRSVQFSAKVFF